MKIDPNSFLDQIIPGHHLAARHETSPSIALYKDDVALAVYEGACAPTAYLAQYSVGFARVFGKHPAYLNMLDFSEITAPDNRVAFALCGDAVQAALYYRRDFDGDALDLCIMGLVSFGSVPRLATPLVAACSQSELLHGRDVTASAHARIMPDGSINAGSAKVFSRAGFYPSRQSSHRITPKNIHLALDAETDGEHFLSLEMIAGHRDLQMASKTILAEWTEGRGGHV